MYQMHQDPSQQEQVLFCYSYNYYFVIIWSALML